MPTNTDNKATKATGKNATKAYKNETRNKGDLTILLTRLALLTKSYMTHNRESTWESWTPTHKSESIYYAIRTNLEIKKKPSQTEGSNGLNLTTKALAATSHSWDLKNYSNFVGLPSF